MSGQYAMAPPDAALQDMFDEFQLRKLVHGYCRAVDRGDTAQLRGMYHDNAKDAHGAFSTRTVEGFLSELAAVRPTCGRCNTTSPRTSPSAAPLRKARSTARQVREA